MAAGDGADTARREEEDAHVITLGQVRERDAFAELVARERARRGMLAFMGRCWNGGARTPFIVGRHTIGICRKLDDAVRRLKQGKSTYMLIRVPVRHGKSLAVSTYFPAFCLAHLWHMDPDIMLVGCDDDLATGFSRAAQEIVQDERYKTLFPGVEVHKKYTSAGEWGCNRRRGRVRALGFGGGAMGRGATILIPDDWCRNREEAESPDLRRKRWDSLRNDLLTRCAPVSIVAIVGTPWHIDGLQERILAEMRTNEDFPRFSVVSYPARTRRDDGTWEYLFPERFGEDWYRERYATLTPYEAAGLLDVNPVAASGNMASRDWFLKVPTPPTGRVVKKVRYWDCAATAKRTSDYTASGCVWKYADGAECIQSITLGRINYAQIGDCMLAQAKVDGPDVEVWIEFEKGSMGLIGPAELAKPLLMSGFTVFLCKRPTGPKHTTWQSMLSAAWQMKGRTGGMPIVDGPNVDTFLGNVDAAPSPAHDDDLDAVSGAHDAVNGYRESEAAVSGGMRMQVR